MSQDESRWEPTSAHVGALTIAVVVPLVAMLLRRPDLIVLAVPFATIAAWSIATRPRGIPEVSSQLSPGVVGEGQVVGWHAFVRVPPGATDAGVVIGESPFFAPEARTHALVADLAPHGDETAELSCRLIAQRWGHYDVGTAIIALTSSFGAFRWSPGQLPDHRVVALPAKEAFTTRTGMPHPTGIVGLNRGVRRGDGTDVATVRPYAPGDRLRRINWKVSTRTGTLHVTATHADLDTQVLLVVDAFHDLGASGGIAGASSSLDTSVRSATALAEHYLRAGERVGLLVLGAHGIAPLAAVAGRAQLRRLRDSLALIRPGTGRGSEDQATASLLARIPPGAVVLLLTPAVSAAALGRCVALARSGMTVLVIDTLPPAVTAERIGVADLQAIAPLESTRDVAVTRSAWRLRLLERAAQLHSLRDLGIPVVAWTGPGSLDEVLRQLQRRARAPRLVRR
ncbi:MAG: DUF58 domain-containing protein [Tetrasphaera sp.]